MQSPDLFSHPYKPEAVSNTESGSEPVHVPEFSDGPDSDSKATTTPSS